MSPAQQPTPDETDANGWRLCDCGHGDGYHQFETGSCSACECSEWTDADQRIGSRAIADLLARAERAEAALERVATEAQRLAAVVELARAYMEAHFAEAKHWDAEPTSAQGLDQWEDEKNHLVDVMNDAQAALFTALEDQS